MEMAKGYCGQRVLKINIKRRGQELSIRTLKDNEVFCLFGRPFLGMSGVQ